VNCGNEAALLLSEGALTELGPTGPVMGVIPEARFSAKQVRMRKDDLLVAFTDGIPDAMNPEEALFGKERLAGLVRAGGASAESLIGRIRTQVEQFAGEAPQFDDITLLAIKRER